MGAVRTCVGCRQRAEQTELIRVVSGSNGFEVSRIAPGRGAWLHPNGRCLDLALTRKAFGRALKSSGLEDNAKLVAHIEQAETMLANK